MFEFITFETEFFIFAIVSFNEISNTNFNVGFITSQCFIGIVFIERFVRWKFAQESQGFTLVVIF